MIDKSSFGFIRYMAQYGIYLGCLVGFFGSIPIGLMMSSPSALIGRVLLDVAAIGIFGLIAGSFFGVICGFLSGGMMLIVTKIFFQIIYDIRLYRVTMGSTTLLTTGMVFLMLPLWSIVNDYEIYLETKFNTVNIDVSLPDDAWYALWLMALVFAVYASQRVATAYLRETDIRKQKVK